ncbi:MAG: HTH-type transcriptional regulator/antitoxin MqsA, partial [Rhodoferax sp.]
MNTVEAAELVRIRKNLKLTPMAASHLTSGRKNAFSCCERGRARPVAAVINLFRLFDRHPELLAELDGDAPSLSWTALDNHP